MLLVGCGSSTGETEATLPPTTDGAGGTLRVAVVGDSIPYNAPEDCPDCTGFVSTFVERAGRATSRPVAVDNFSRHDDAGVDDIVAQLDTSPQLAAAVTEAEIVLVSIGTFDMPPWPAGAPCGGPAAAPAEVVTQVVAFTQDCIDQKIAADAEKLGTIFETIAAAATDRPAILLALTVYNAAIDDPSFPFATDADRQRFQDVMVQVHLQWNTTLCQVADANGFTCVDVAAAFNGADGRTPVGTNVAADHLHPSQQGNDAIAGLLAAVDLSTLAA